MNNLSFSRNQYTQRIFIFFLFIFLHSIVVSREMQVFSEEDYCDEIIVGFNFKKAYGIDPQYTPFLSTKNLVYVVSKKGVLYCFDKRKNICWKKCYVSTNSPPSFTPEGRVCFLSASEKKIIYLTPEGATLNIYSNNIHKFFPPIIDRSGEVHFVVKQFGHRYRMTDIEEEICKELDLFSPNDQKEGFPLCDPNGNVFFVLIPTQGITYFFDPQENIYFGLIPDSVGKIQKDKILIGRNRDIFFITNSNCLNCMNYSGEIYWKHEFSCTISSPLAINENNIIYFGGDDEKLYCADPKTQKWWCHNIRGKISCAPKVGGDRRIFSLSEDGYVFWNEKVFPVLELNPYPSLSWE